MSASFFYANETYGPHERIREDKAILVINVFRECHTNLPREAIGPQGSNRFLRGVRANISKETYSHSLTPSGSAHALTYDILVLSH